LVLASKLDTAGLDAQGREVVGVVTDMARQMQGLPPLEIDTNRVVSALEAAGLDVNEFFRGFSEAIAEFHAVAEAAESSAAPLADLTTALQTVSGRLGEAAGATSSTSRRARVGIELIALLPRERVLG
jgi:ABC-type transporter Mla subunit MlaD